MRRASWPSLITPAAIHGVAVLAAASFLVFASWSSFRRHEEIEDHLDSLVRLRSAGLELQESVMNSTAGSPQEANERLQRVRASVARLLEIQPLLDRDSAGRMLEASGLLARLREDPEAASLALMELAYAVSQAEEEAHGELVTQLERESRRDLWVGGALALLMPLSAGLMVFLLRRRLWHPLRELEVALRELGSGRYRLADPSRVDPVLHETVLQYNRLVERLQELEALQGQRQSQLEAQVRRTARALLAQQEELNRVGRLAVAGEVAASVAHELRNPLAGIDVALRRLRERVTEPEAAKIDLVLREVVRMSTALRSLIERTSTRPEEKHPVELAALATEVVELVRLQAPSGVEVGLRLDLPNVDWRPTLAELGFRQALMNLVLNAVQAVSNGAGSRVDVTVSRSVDDDREAVRVEVRDDGPGFPPALLEDGIRPFASFREGGTGLGLASTRRFAAEHGGSVEIENLAGGGGRSRLALPV